MTFAPFCRRAVGATLLWVAGTAGSLPALEVQVLRPLAADLAFGPVELELEVGSEHPVRKVEIYLDGSLVQLLERPPYRTIVDTGHANVEHHFRVVVEDVFGQRAEDEVGTSRIEVNDEVEVELQQLFVSVSQRGNPVPGLQASDFSVLSDRGSKEEIVTFGGGDLPISSVLLVDASESMRGEPLAGAVQAVKTFSSLTRPEDETTAVFFSDRLLHSAQLTEGEDVDAFLAGLEARGTTAVNDHLYYALNRLETRLGRRVVVLLSDGLDITSLLDMSEVLWRARRSQAMIYWLRLEGREAVDDPAGFSSSWRTPEENRRQYATLDQMVSDSGGRVIPVWGVGQLDSAFRSVIQELRQQYVLGFHPSDRRHDGSWRPIRVRLPKHSYDVRARAGYIDG